MQTLFQNGDEQIDRDSAPDLRAHRVRTRAVEGFDAQVLLDPFEEQFDLPAAMIQLRNGQGGGGEVVGQKDQGVAGFGIAITDAPQRGGIIAPRVKADRHDGLIKPQAGGFVERPGIAAGRAEVFLGARDKKGGALVEAMQACKVQIATIHDVERAGLPSQLVEEVHVVNTARSDNDDGGKVALQGEQRVEFDGGFAAAEGGPREQRETQVNGGGVQRVSGGLEFDAETLTRVQRGGLLDQDVGEVSEDAPVAFFVGIGQRAARGGLADAGVIELWAKGSQTGFDVAQTFTPGQLGECQHEELFVSWQLADAEVAVVTGDTLVELIFGEEVEELGENRATFVHREKQRQRAVEHPRKPVLELKSKKGRTAMEHQFYRTNIAVRKNLTGQ